MSTDADKAGLTTADKSQLYGTLNSDGDPITSFDEEAGTAHHAPQPPQAPPGAGDIAIARLGAPIHTTCCPTGTLEFASAAGGDDDDGDEAGAAYEGCCDAVEAVVSALTLGMSRHRPKFLVLCGSLRADSCSRRVAVEASRILASYSADVKLFDPTDLPLFTQDQDPTSIPKVVELRSLTSWCEGMVWVSPEVHGNYSAVFKNQIDWMPLSVGAIRPTQGKTVAVMQVEAGSQSFNTVNNLRVLGRWMRMVVIPNQVSIPRAYDEFEEDGSLKDSPYKHRIVDVVDELYKYTLLLRDQQPYLLARYSERRAAEAANLRGTTDAADASVLRDLVNPTIIDVRSDRELASSAGGEALAGSFHVPLNVNNDPQTVHVTTTEEFRSKLREAGVDLPKENKEGLSFITHCTAGNTSYISRGARAAALLRNMGYLNSHNGGSADDVRTALGL